MTDKKQKSVKKIEPLSSAELSNNKLAEIVNRLDKNEAINEEIKKSVKFIKNYFLWRSVFNFLKYTVLVVIIILGFISWHNIADYLLKFYG